MTNRHLWTKAICPGLLLGVVAACNQPAAPSVEAHQARVVEILLHDVNSHTGRSAEDVDSGSGMNSACEMRIEIPAIGAQRFWVNGTEIDHSSWHEYRESFRKLIQNESCDETKIQVFAQNAGAAQLFPFLDAVSAAAENEAASLRIRHDLLFLNDQYIE